LAKVPDQVTPALAHYARLMEQVAIA